MLLLVIPLFLALVMLSNQLIALPVYLAMSLITLLVFGFDKRRAITQGWRVPENTLHLLELLCGWPGALIGMRQFRHKNQKASYFMPTYTIIGLHFIVWGYLAWSGLTAQGMF